MTALISVGLLSLILFYDYKAWWHFVAMLLKLMSGSGCLNDAWHYKKNNFFWNYYILYLKYDDLKGCWKRYCPALDQPHLIFYRAMQAGLLSDYSTAQAQQIEV